MLCRFIAPLTFIALLLSCSTQTTPESSPNRAVAETPEQESTPTVAENQAETPEPESSPAAVKAPEGEPETLPHQVVVDLSDPARPTFRACDASDSEAPRQLKASPELIESLIAVTELPETSPRDNLDVVLKGQLFSDRLVAEAWLAADYPCDIPFKGRGWSAKGDEPFWAFDFEGDSGTWVMPEGYGPDGRREVLELKLVSQPTDLTASTLTWTWRGPEGKTWKFEFKEKTCRPDMSAGIYPYFVTVSRRVDFGCGYRKR